MTDTLSLPAFVTAPPETPDVATEMATEPENRRWRIEDTGSAEWALGRWRQAQAQRQALEAQAQAWKDRIDAWLEHETGPIAQRQEFFEGHLTDYLRRCREADPKVKSITLPSGKITSTAAAESVAVTDITAFEAWAQEVGAEHLLRYKAEPIMAEVKSELEIADDGTVRWQGTEVPGTVVRPPSVRYAVKPT